MPITTDSKIRFLVFLMVGSFVVWLVLRERSLKEEATHYETDFRYWRNLVVGLLVTIPLVSFLIWLYYELNPSPLEQQLEEFRKARGYK